jgi:hypothetical protein
MASAYPFPTQKILDNPQIFSPCPSSHWDPTTIYKKHTVPLLPDNTTPNTMLPMDPRPWARISLEYRNSGSSEETVQSPPQQTVFPNGGSHYPPSRYYEAINVENDLHRLGRPLERDIFDTYTPGPAIQSMGFYVPSPRTKLSAMARNMADPPILEQIGANPCMTAELGCMKYNLASCSSSSELACMAAGPLWFHATKQEKYKETTGCGASKWEYVGGKPPSATNLPPV